VFIPEQSVDSGVLLLEVSQQSIAKVVVKGAHSPDMSAGCAGISKAITSRAITSGGDGLAVVQSQSAVVGTRSTLRGWSTCHRVVIIGIAERQGRVQICAPPDDRAAVLHLLRTRTAVGGVVQVRDALAYACLQVQRDYVYLAPTTCAPLASRPAQEFWHHARAHLQSFRKLPLKFFQLYLADACLRFNHRGQDLCALLKESMSNTASGDLKLLLSGEIAKEVSPPNVTHQCAMGCGVELTSAEV
jgi:transposase-like protein